MRLNSVQPQYNNANAQLSRNTAPNFNAYYYQQQPEESSVTKEVGTVAILQGLILGLKKCSEWCGQKLMQGKEFTSFENIKKVSDKMVKDNKLNVEIGYIDQNNIGKYAGKYGKGIANELQVVAEGKNAFYADKLKLAVAPKSKPSLMLHELGHAINAKNGFTKLLQNSRRLAPFIPTALLMMTPHRSANEKPSFIEKNAGILAFAASVPTIVEEGMASFKGVKAAKEVLGKSVNLNALKRNYLFALGTYAIAGIATGIATKQAFAQRPLDQRIMQYGQNNFRM
ncbi:MAG: hypothetical protein R3Y28_05000 [Candidatus Gastranaerophilales bacterium]